MKSNSTSKISYSINFKSTTQSNSASTTKSTVKYRYASTLLLQLHDCLCFKTQTLSLPNKI